MSNHMNHLNAICDMKDRFIEWTKEEQGYLASCGTRDEGTHEVRHQRSDEQHELI